jgi:hypothetical protein
MNIATPADDTTTATMERTCANEDRAQGSKPTRVTAATTLMVEGATVGGREKKGTLADDDSDDVEDNDEDDEDATSSVKKAEETVQAKAAKRRRSRNEEEEYVPMTFPQKVCTSWSAGVLQYSPRHWSGVACMERSGIIHIHRSCFCR